MRKAHVRIIAAVLLVASVGLWHRVTVHAQQSPAVADILPALLSEVKGLRAAMEQMASTNVHAQLLVGRLQLQESRMAGMIRRLDTIRDALAAARRDLNEAADGVRRMEGQRDAQISQEDWNALQDQRKRNLAAMKANVARLTSEEAQLAGELTAEQGRWVDISQRLDELERSLTKRQ
jgi:hypothetical protein